MTSKHIVVVQRGDTLCSIARLHMGNENHWRKIYDLNGLCSTVILPGKHLLIPDERFYFVGMVANAQEMYSLQRAICYRTDVDKLFTKIGDNWVETADGSYLSRPKTTMK